MIMGVRVIARGPPCTTKNMWKKTRFQGSQHLTDTRGPGEAPACRMPAGREQKNKLLNQKLGFCIHLKKKYIYILTVGAILNQLNPPTNPFYSVNLYNSITPLKRLRKCNSMLNALLIPARLKNEAHWTREPAPSIVSPTTFVEMNSAADSYPINTPGSCWSCLCSVHAPPTADVFFRLHRSVKLCWVKADWNLVTQEAVGDDDDDDDDDDDHDDDDDDGDDVTHSFTKMCCLEMILVAPNRLSLWRELFWYTWCSSKSFPSEHAAIWGKAFYFCIFWEFYVLKNPRYFFHRKISNYRPSLQHLPSAEKTVHFITSFYQLCYRDLCPAVVDLLHFCPLPANNPIVPTSNQPKCSWV